MQTPSDVRRKAFLGICFLLHLRAWEIKFSTDTMPLKKKKKKKEKKKTNKTHKTITTTKLPKTGILWEGRRKSGYWSANSSIGHHVFVSIVGNQERQRAEGQKANRASKAL